MKQLPLVLAVVLALGSVGPVIAADPPADVSGVYTYGDSTIFLTRMGQLYEYREVAKDGTTWTGPAIYKDGTLVASWLRADGKDHGVSLLKVELGEKGPRMTGVYGGIVGGPQSAIGTYKPAVEFVRKLDK